MMNLKKKLGLIVGALALTASIGLGTTDSIKSIDIAGNGLPLEYSVKRDIAGNGLPLEYSVKRDIAGNGLPLEYSVKRDIAGNGLPLEYSVKHCNFK
ncbi:hypothetical protein BLD48_14715 [Exiguobacterium sp. KRL4]|uniref:hypothetical protein n=1 Tax=Exiguobacterium sp. KRL4 TaxID=1914536 RepID=UPI0008F90762|nr:hypothetical protein [Exiguobacterium sp. KRL4]OIN65673.1 hypothetical protein BLD48_14715 [Exiguobacterium sp. KRL4]